MGRYPCKGRRFELTEWGEKNEEDYETNISSYLKFFHAFVVGRL